MDYIYIGDIVNTHGLKGEVRILSDFEEKEVLFQIGRILYIGSKKEPVVITNYRKHKIYDMVTLEDKQSIDDVIIYKGEMVYANRQDLDLKDLIDDDYIGLEAIVKNEKKGVITDIISSKAHNIFVVEGTKKYLIPKRKEFIETIDLEKKIIYFIDMKGLFDED